MSDQRLADLEQRVKDLEVECAGLAVCCAILFETVQSDLDVDPEVWAGFISAARKRWPELATDDIERVMHGLLLLWSGRGRPRHEGN